MAIGDATHRFAWQPRQIIIFDLVGFCVEEIDQEAPLPAEEVMVQEVTIEEATCGTTMVERVTVSEHYLAVEYVPVHPPERRMKPRDKAREMVA